MTDHDTAKREWHTWIVEACTAPGVDPALVDVTGIHDLTREVSRPMAPVGAFIWGLALGQSSSPDAPPLTTAAALKAAIAGARPRPDAPVPD